jgi:polyhydroxybutyrate depolymerase
MVNKLSFRQVLNCKVPSLSPKSTGRRCQTLLKSCARAIIAIGVLGVSVKVATAETYRGSFESGHVERQYIVNIPDGTPDGRRLPTVIVLHGPLMNGASMRRLFDMDDIAEREGFAVVYPDSYGRTWNDGRNPAEQAPNDVRFINQLAKHLVDDGLADPNRLYLVGLSSGGMLSFRVACETPRTFAAFGAIVANMPKELVKRCRPNAGVSMLIINSRHDRDIPDTSDQADWNQGRVISSAATVEFWRKNNGCGGNAQTKTMPDRDLEDGSTVAAEQYQDCTTGTPLVSFMVEGDGHLPPGARLGNRPLLVSVLGRPNRDISAADISWKFFRRFSIAP